MVTLALLFDVETSRGCSAGTRAANVNFRASLKAEEEMVPSWALRVARMAVLSASAVRGWRWVSGSESEPELEGRYSLSSSESEDKTAASSSSGLSGKRLAARTLAWVCFEKSGFFLFLPTSFSFPSESSDPGELEGKAR